MKVSEILRNMMDFIDGMEGEVQKSTEPVKYANEPAEVTRPVKAVIATGDDIHHSKHPSDMRSDSVSMYPNAQYKPKE